MKKIILSLFVLSFINITAQKSHPNLALTKSDVSYIQSKLGGAPLFDKSLEAIKSDIDKVILQPMQVPLPKDPGGGYTHEQHKKNYNIMHKAGILFSLTRDEKYASYIRDMLNEYAEFYPTLGKHPEGKRQTPGRLFWQSLNETVWLLHTIQAYDCIYDWLKPEERKSYEERIFLPMVEFFMTDCIHEFDLIHNHGTWSVAAVGMTGYVLGRDDFVKKALYGSDEKGETGFFAQLDKLFSPDGYYTEGGYYVRYALWPFFIFAEVIKNNQPELGIYKYRNQILEKALNSALQVTYTDGVFMPINDALKEKTWMSPELIFAVNFVYSNYEQDEKLLNIVKLHNEVSITKAGLDAALGLNNAESLPPFKWESVEYTDGPNGDEGGIGIFRYGANDDQEAVLFKYGGHGLSHGHFDKLTFLFYDQGREIIQDYGAARFLNVEQKFGGRYLHENDSFVKQTVGHNTLVVDGKSQFNGKRSESEKHHSNRFCFNADDVNFQYAGAKESNAYDGVEQHRTLILINGEKLTRPILVDLLKVESEDTHQYDLPFYYMGHLIHANFKYTPYTTARTLMGSDNGYEHLWKEAEADLNSTSQITWWNGSRFYSITSNTGENSKVYFARIGGTDPEFNLRNEPAVIFRSSGKSKLFASVIEPHGDFNPTLEYSYGSYSSIKNIRVIYSDNNYSVAEIVGKDFNWNLMLSHKNSDKSKKHSVTVNGKKLSWTGPVAIQK
ncbi:MAG: alginate lyase family protein [Bacteroidota bacterium]